MASTIKIKRSSVAGKAPTTSDLSVGELALNTKDQKLYSSNGSAVFQLANAQALANTNASIATKLDANNPVITGTLTANGSVGSNDYVLKSSGSGIYWGPSASGGAASFTYKTVDNLTQNDQVVTSATAVDTVVDADALNGYLQVSNSFNSMIIKSGNTASVTTVQENIPLNAAVVANPDGHLAIIINGTTYKIPYFL